MESNSFFVRGSCIEILGMRHAAHDLQNDGWAKNGLGQQILVVTGIFEKKHYKRDSSETLEH